MNSRFGLWIFALSISPLMFAACGDDGDDDDDDGGTGGKGGTSMTGGTAGEGGGSGRGGTSGQGGTAGRGGTSGASGSAGTAGPGGEGGLGGAGGEGGGGGSGAVDPGARIINMNPPHFFPEGVALDRDGNFYLGSMYLGLIYKANAESDEAVPFIHAGTNDLVSVLGMYAEDGDGSDANPGTLWVCSSDAGNGSRAGTAPVALKAFNLKTGAPTGSWPWPAPTPADPNVSVNGFCNDITVDAEGNVYATDSWYPRILRLPKTGRTSTTPLEIWKTDPRFGEDMWHLNGIDVDQATRTLYVVENHPGGLFKIPINTDGSAGTVTPIATSPALRGPDGLKVIAPNLLATGEGSGVSLIEVTGNTATVTEVFQGLDGIATLALHQASAWIVENQGDHFWNSANAGPNADPPFRLVEVPLDVGAGARIIETTTPQFFSEGTTADTAGNLYVGSMQLGSIHKATASASRTTQFIAPGTQGLVSVIGMYAHTDTNKLWVCSSDTDVPGAPNGPTTLKAFDLDDGGAAGSWDWPAPMGTPHDGTTANGFCNDITRDAAGRVYATDSWYPRIVRLPANATSTDMLTTWFTDTAFNAGTTGAATQWHLNGIDVDPAGENLYIVENHPGHLWRLGIQTNGNPGTLTEITTSRPLRNPDGLKVVNATTLAVAEGSGMALITLSGNTGQVRTVSTGFDGIATFALLGGAAWLVENQADHFWGASGPQGPTANKPFRLIETPLALPQ
ncbi:MAG TPA: SMP-30/gluconolactonase/LRE family protein [Polyangiaceae bacterium]